MTGWPSEQLWGCREGGVCGEGAAQHGVPPEMPGLLQVLPLGAQVPDLRIWLY